MQTMAPPEDALTERLARLDERIGDVDRRVAEATKDTGRRFDDVNRRITEFKEETNHRFDRVEGDIKELKQSVASVHVSVLSLHTTLTRIGIGLAIVFASALLVQGF
ncbi:MAG TPA: hypothetical protein VFZ29_10310 [Solirubrobacterales bacterium]